MVKNILNIRDIPLKTELKIGLSVLLLYFYLVLGVLLLHFIYS